MDGDYETDLVRLEDIRQVPITMFIADKDATCLPETARRESRLINSKTRSIIVEGNHEFFMASNDKEFVRSLTRQLKPE